MPKGLPSGDRVYGPPKMSGNAVILTDQQVNAIRNITSGSIEDAAKRFGVSTNTINNIWKNKGRFADVPFNGPSRG